MGPIALERRTGFTWATKLPAPRSLPSFPLWKPADVWTSSSANTWATSCPNSELGPSTELENSLPPPGNLRAVSDTHSVLSPRAAANRRPSSDGYNRLVFATMEGESPVAPLRNHSQNTEDEVGRISFSAEGVGRYGRALSYSRGGLAGAAPYLVGRLLAGSSIPADTLPSSRLAPRQNGSWQTWELMGNRLPRTAEGNGSDPNS